MTPENSLAHTKWMCKYHIVWIPKCRKKKLFGDLRRELGPVLRELARQRESEIEQNQEDGDQRFEQLNLLQMRREGLR